MSKQQFNIPEKANRVLNIILVTMLLFVVRVWHLSVIQYNDRVEQSRKPQRKVVVEAAKRATIRDRFNMPLAINNIQYNAAILYSQFKQIPSIVWAKDADGKRIKKFRRKEYISELANVLANELDLDPERLEDLIHAKASFYYHVPYVIKDDLTEREYYRLKMLEKDWLGITVQRLPKRTYPLGKVGADIIGYMGAINRQEYEGIIGQIKILEQYLKSYEEGESPETPKGIASASEARVRLKELIERAYTVNDHVGKMGVEGKFEEKLRGFQGRKSYYSDARGNFLRELPGSRDPLSGERLLLTISAELQEFAEDILIQNEQIREAHLSKGESGQQTLASLQPWIKGGAIIAMDPNNGEILAMASYPRFDPNDFITSGNSEVAAEKRSNIQRWFETEDYLGQIWDQKRPLEREIYDPLIKQFREEGKMMTWDAYLASILPQHHIVSSTLQEMNSISNCIELQRTINELLTLSGQSDLYWLLTSLYSDQDGHETYGKKIPADVKAAIKENLSWHEGETEKLKRVLNRHLRALTNDYDKVLAVDLSRLVVNEEKFSPLLLEEVGSQSLSTHHNASSAFATVAPAIRSMAKSLFHQTDFKSWRQANEKEFLKQKRAEEKLADQYPRPYIDYLDQKENELFNDFWLQYRWTLLETILTGETSSFCPNEYSDYFTLLYDELTNNAHQEVIWRKSYDILYGAVNEVPRDLTVDYLKSLRTYSDLNRPTLGQYKHLRKHNRVQLERDLAAAFYPVYGYGYGRSFAYRQASTQGSIFKLAVAYTALIQKYHELDKNDETITKRSLNPLTITDSVEHHGNEWLVGYHADGKPIPQQYKGGRLPRSANAGIGKLDIVKAIENSSNPYFALLAGDVISTPNAIADTARLLSYGQKTGVDLPAEISGKIPTDLNSNRTGLYATAIGQHTLVVTPLQASVFISAIANGGSILKPQIVHQTIGSNKDSSYSVEDVFNAPIFTYQDSLNLIGIDFSLFTATARNSKKNEVSTCKAEICRSIFMPQIVRSTLLDGMNRVVAKISNPNLNSLNRMYRNYPEAIRDFLEVQSCLSGKTSTAEAMENIGLDLNLSTGMYTHIWFSGIAFESKEKKETFVYNDPNGKPELVVIVYLRFGKWGKETAPLAAQVVKKWRGIKEKRKINQEI